MCFSIFSSFTYKFKNLYILTLIRISVGLTHQPSVSSIFKLNSRRFKNKKIKKIKFSNRRYKNLFPFRYYINKTWKMWKLFVNLYYTLITLKSYLVNLNYQILYKDSYLVIRNLLIIFIIDMLIIDDEPLWEPIEWSLVQTWLLFILLFSWIVEGFISSKFGSYTGRDKRVWLALYKTFWFLEFWFCINLGITALFIIAPFYFELNYMTSGLVLWWNWYNIFFFFKYISFILCIIIFLYIIQLGQNWLNFKKIFLILLGIYFLFFYLLFTNFYITFFSYFTNVASYQTYKTNTYFQFSISINKWAWGPLDRDHFTHHRTPLTFWFKSDAPYAYSLFLINIFFFFSLFFIFFQLTAILRFMYSTQTITFTLLTYLTSLIKHFFLAFLFFNFLILFCIIMQWLRVSFEFSVFQTSALLLNNIYTYLYDLFGILLF